MSTVNQRRGRHVDRRLIKRVGRPTLWESADLCSNLREDGQHSPYCTDCPPGGRGYVYTTEIADLRMIWMRDKRDQSFDAAGAWEQGSAIAVFPCHHPIAEQDRLTPAGDPVMERLTIKRGEAASTPDLIRSPNVVAILSVRAGSTSYTEGTDFTLTTNSAGQYQISWTGNGSQPTVETHYSVRMHIKPVWIVDGDPKIRAFGAGKGNQLMKTAECKRYDAAAVFVEES